MTATVRADLTNRQREVVEAFKKLKAETGRPPAFREWMHELGIRSPNGMACHVRALVRKGVMRRIGDGTRNYALADEPLSLDELAKRIRGSVTQYAVGDVGYYTRVAAASVSLVIEPDADRPRLFADAFRCLVHSAAAAGVDLTAAVADSLKRTEVLP